MNQRHPSTAMRSNTDPNNNTGSRPRFRNSISLSEVWEDVRAILKKLEAIKTPFTPKDRRDSHGFEEDYFHFDPHANSSNSIHGDESQPCQANTGRRVFPFTRRGSSFYDTFTFSRRNSKANVERPEDITQPPMRENALPYAMPQPRMQQQPESVSQPSGLQDSTSNLSSYLKELQATQIKLQQHEAELKSAEKKTAQLYLENCHLVVEKKPPKTANEAEVRLEEIVKRLENLQEMFGGDYVRQDIVLKLEFEQAEMLIFLKRYDDAEAIAKEVLQKRQATVERASDYESSFHQVCKIIINRPTDRKRKEAIRLLENAYGDHSELNDSGLKIREDLCSLLALGNNSQDMQHAAFHQRRILEERAMRYNNKSGTMEDLVNCAFHLAEIYDTIIESCGPEALWIKGRIDVFGKVWQCCNEKVGENESEEVMVKLLTAGYRLGKYHCSEKKWSDAERVLTTVIEEMRRRPLPTQQLPKTQVLRSLASVYLQNGIKNDTKAEIVVRELYQELKYSPNFGLKHEDTLRYGCELGTLILSQSGKHNSEEATNIMTEVLDMQEQALSRGEHVAQELLRVAFSYSCRLWKLVEDMDTGRPVLRDRNTLLSTTERSFKLIWSAISNNPNAKELFEDSEILEVGRNLVACFVERSKISCAAALELGNELWATKKRLSKTTRDTNDFGYDLGTCFRSLHDTNADKAAVNILYDIWNQERRGKDPRCGNALGICLSRLGRYEESGDVQEEVWKRITSKTSKDDIAEYAYNYGCCLLELGEYPDAYKVLKAARFPEGHPCLNGLEHAMLKATEVYGVMIALDEAESKLDKQEDHVHETPTKPDQPKNGATKKPQGPKYMRSREKRPSKKL